LNDQLDGLHDFRRGFQHDGTIDEGSHYE
jgi:hypothetical protein